MTVVDEPVVPDSLVAAATSARFHLIAHIEGVPTGDDRIYVEGGMTWRDLPLPLMADDKNRPEHNEATLIGNIDTIERIGPEIHCFGDYLSQPEGDAARLIGLMQRGELRGVSADLDDVEFEVLFPVEEAAAEDPADDGLVPIDSGDDEWVDSGLPRETDADGNVVEVLTITNPTIRITQSRIMGATVLPFPAQQESMVLDPLMPPEPVETEPMDPPADEPAPALAAAATLAAREAHPDRFTFPDLPPAAWFDVPETPGPMPLTILDSGQVFGHLAVWGECHIGISGECVEPPASACGYARFHVGETPCDDGTRVATGHLTFATGHAATHLGADATRAHYDNTGTVAADVVASDGEYGIWVCGAMRPSLTTAQVREVMGAPPSGDWRRFGRNLELVGALCVNVPGFNTPRYQLAASAQVPVAGSYAKVRKSEGLVASLIVSHPAVVETPRRTTGGLDDETARRVIARIATTIGRDPKSRIAALAARVHRST